MEELRSNLLNGILGAVSHHGHHGFDGPARVPDSRAKADQVLVSGGVHGHQGKHMGVVPVDGAGFFRVVNAQNQVGALLQEPLRDGTADAGAGAGDHAQPVFKKFFHNPLLISAHRRPYPFRSSSASEDRQ